MLWTQQLVDRAKGPQTVNDSKTPSGPVHVGALRGVLIHDAVYIALRQNDIPARYLFGVDDYDPLDEIPSLNGEWLRPYLGVPLCNVPSPPGSTATDLAEYYISDLFAAFKKLGVGAETYRMRDIYRSGKFDPEIDTILRNAHIVRRVDREVAGARRSDDWFPFQVICQQCGKIGTTRVYAYDGQRVAYKCEPHLVGWALGCSYSGQTSPFSGNGKLSWKLEWVAKWNNFPVTIEGAGKDHNSKGGSREVAVKCLNEIFHRVAPANIPYEFFLVHGAKMSSSRGVGVSARQMAEFLPPEVLRFLMIRTHPSKTVDFSPEEQRVVRLFDDFDRMRNAALLRPAGREAQLCTLTEVHKESAYYSPPFQLLLSLLQMPHIDVIKEIEQLKGKPLSSHDILHLEQRIGSAEYWLKHFASEEDRLELKNELPPQASSLRPTQVAFLHRLAKDLESTVWTAQAIQAQIFDTARRTPLAQEAAFVAIYTIFFGRKSGPRAGNILAVLDPRFVLQRLKELPLSVEEFNRESSVTIDEFESWLQSNSGRILSLSAELHVYGRESEVAPDVGSGPENFVEGVGLIEFSVVFRDGTTHARRCMFAEFEGFGSSFKRETETFLLYAREYIEELEERFKMPIDLISPQGEEGMQSTAT